MERVSSNSVSFFVGLPFWTLMSERGLDWYHSSFVGMAHAGGERKKNKDGQTREQDQHFPQYRRGLDVAYLPSEG
jgi:hypothetical protein